jgi:hypothetical protein
MDERGMEEEGNDREGEWLGIEKKYVILICFGIVIFDKTVYRNPLKPVGQNKVYTYNSYIHTYMF